MILPQYKSDYKPFLFSLANGVTWPDYPRQTPGSADEGRSPNGCPSVYLFVPHLDPDAERPDLLLENL
jgi:hypothetical protein